MKSFKQFVNESIFTAHNGAVLHKHIVNHLVKNIKQLPKNKTFSFNASDAHHSLPDDLNLTVHLGEAGSSKDHDHEHRHWGMFSVPRYNRMRHVEGGHIELHFSVPTGHDWKNKDALKKHLSNPQAESITMHEYTHHSQWKRDMKTLGDFNSYGKYIEGARVSRVGGKEYYTNPGEVESHTIETAHLVRKMGAHDFIRKATDPLRFAKFAHHNPDKIGKVADYIKRKNS